MIVTFNCVYVEVGFLSYLKLRFFFFLKEHPIFPHTLMPFTLAFIHLFYLTQCLIFNSAVAD